MNKHVIQVEQDESVEYPIRLKSMKSFRHLLNNIHKELMPDDTITIAFDNGKTLIFRITA